MRASRAAAAASRRRLVEEAAALFRARGVEGASVADVCAAAGLTHGGFYKHFASKDALLAEATAAAFAPALARFDRRAARDGARAAAAAYAADYLSPAHLAHPERGCPLAAYGAEAGRGSEAASRALAEGVEALIARFAEVEGSREAALALAARLVGAVVIARAVGPGALRRETLAAASGDDR